MENSIIFDHPKMFGIDDARELLNSLCVLSTIRSYSIENVSNESPNLPTLRVLSTIRSYSILAEKVIYSFECTELPDGKWRLILGTNSEEKFITYKESEFECIMDALIHVASIGFAILHEMEHTNKE